MAESTLMYPDYQEDPSGSARTWTAFYNQATYRHQSFTTVARHPGYRHCTAPLTMPACT